MQATDNRPILVRVQVEPPNTLVAQLDRALACDARCRRFESFQECQLSQWIQFLMELKSIKVLHDFRNITRTVKSNRLKIDYAVLKESYNKILKKVYDKNASPIGAFD